MFEFIKKKRVNNLMIDENTNRSSKLITEEKF